MTSVVYPGSFNPITNGHRDIVERALRLFDKVVVAVGTSPDKDPETHLAERIGLCRLALAEFGDRVEVEGFNTLLVDYAHAKNTRFVVRGLRTISDFDYEYQMIAMNQTLDPTSSTSCSPLPGSGRSCPPPACARSPDWAATFPSSSTRPWPPTTKGPMGRNALI